MSESDDDESGSPLIRVLRRSLNIKRGITETPKLRKNPQGWSTRGQQLIDRFSDLVAVYDRICLLVDPLMDDDDAEALVGRFETLVGEIDRITAAQVSSGDTARDRQKALVAAQIQTAEQLEQDLQDFQADHCNPTPGAISGLLTSASPAAARLLKAEGKGRLEALVGKLPPTQATVTALEQAEDLILANPPGWISKEAHEVFYKMKTDALEQVVADKVDDSEDPKMAGLKDLPQTEYWKLLMDGRHQGGGDKHFFDQSQGYMASMMKGLGKIVDEIDEPMSVDFVKQMHTCSTYQVTEQTGDTFFGSNRFQEQGLKKAPNGWGMCFDFSDDGLDELRAMRDQMNLAVPGYFEDDEPAELRRGDVRKNVAKVKAAEGLRGRPPGQIQAAVETLMQDAIDRYRGDLINADHLDDKADRIDGIIGAVIDCCRRLGQVHPFKDANGRLMMFLLLNKMLLENGMSPTILDDQGYMIGKSREELVALIKQGQERVDALKR